MKITNIFKKSVKATAKNKVQTLDKKQLSKVIGGSDEAGKEKTVTINTSHVEWSN